MTDAYPIHPGLIGIGGIGGAGGSAFSAGLYLKAHRTFRPSPPFPAALILFNPHPLTRPRILGTGLLEAPCRGKGRPSGCKTRITSILLSLPLILVLRITAQRLGFREIPAQAATMLKHRLSPSPAAPPAMMPYFLLTALTGFPAGLRMFQTRSAPA